MGRLDGKVALIVGGGRNIGRASAKLFASEGAKIAIFDMDEERAASVTEEVAEQGGECMHTIGEVQSVADVKRTVAAVVERYGRIDALLNCAALRATGSIVRDKGGICARGGCRSGEVPIPSRRARVEVLAYAVRVRHPGEWETGRSPVFGTGFHWPDAEPSPNSLLALRQA